MNLIPTAGPLLLLCVIYRAAGYLVMLPKMPNSSKYHPTLHIYGSRTRMNLARHYPQWSEWTLWGMR